MTPAQLTLVSVEPPPVPGIDLRLCSVDTLIADASLHGQAALILADPPWSYTQDPGATSAADHYDGLPVDAIARSLADAVALARPGCRLGVWSTWPLDEEWMRAVLACSGWPWRYITGGSWIKLGGAPGIGYHWRGESEPIRVYAAEGPTGRPRTTLASAHIERGPHSEKPLPWLVAMVEAWTDPGDLVVDLYAGLAPLADACILTGRRYVGAELDPERHRRALGMVASGVRR
jgi:hypothetical protein